MKFILPLREPFSLLLSLEKKMSYGLRKKPNMLKISIKLSDQFSICKKHKIWVRKNPQNFML